MNALSPTMNTMNGPVAQTFLPAGSRHIPVPHFYLAKTGDWKAARTRRLESLRYVALCLV